MTEDRADVRTADRRREAVAFGDLLDQAGIGAGIQVFNGNVVGPAFGEIVSTDGLVDLPLDASVVVPTSFPLEL